MWGWLLAVLMVMLVAMVIMRRVVVLLLMIHSMMMMIQGAFQSIPNIAKRMQKVIREEVPDKG